MILALGCVILIGGRAEAAGDAVQRLRQIADGPVETTYSRNSQYPSFIRSRIPITTGSDALDAEAASGQFLADFGDVFGVVDPVSELKLVKDEVDDLGMSHVTYQQVYDGIPVYHATLKAHLSQGNRMVVAVGNGFLASLRANTTAPVLADEEAIMNAMLALPGGSITDQPALTLYPTKLDGTLTTARLAWLVDIQDNNLSAYNRYVIDAVNGEFIDAINLVSGYHFGEWDAVAPAAADDEDNGPHAQARQLPDGKHLPGN